MGAGRSRALWVLPFVVSGLWAAAAAGQGRPVRPGDEMQVVINEFMASNQSTIQSPDRRYSDWIELHNPSNTNVDLAGMYLSDDSSAPAKWQFPVGSPSLTTIGPGGYLLIWADGGIASAGLHADFKLSADGEEIVLVASDGVTVIDSVVFGPQRTDISCGLYPDGSDEWRFMAVPTPGAANVSVYDGIAEAPRISRAGGLFTEPLTVTLATETPGATIYYTTDGSVPYSEARQRPGGNIYAGPIQITNTTTVRAVAWRPGWRQSEVSSERYIFISRDLQGFNSNLPLIVLDQSESPITAARSSEAYLALVDRSSDGRARFSGPATLHSRVMASVRGSSSQQFPKRMFGVHLVDEDGDNRKESLLGMPAEHNWVLYAPYSDKSLMRNAVAYGMSNDIGRYAPRTRFVELFLHSGVGPLNYSHYHGVYVLVERIKWADGRVEIAKLEPADDSEPEITGGYIIKKDRLNPGEQGLRTSRGAHLAYVRPNERDITVAQRQWLIGYLNQFESALFGTGFADPHAGYAAFIDPESFVDLHLITELCKEIDGYRLSTFMHKDRGGKLTMGPLWDFNLSLGNANYLDGWNPQGWYYPLISQSDYLHGWYTRLFQDPVFRLLYADRWFEFRRGAFTTDRLLEVIDDYAALLDESQARNFARWPILGRYVWPNWYIANTYRQEIVWMKGWLTERLAWMDDRIAIEYAAAPPAFNQQGGHVETGFVLAMDGPGTIHYTLDGSDPRSLTASDTVHRTVLIPESAPKRVHVPTGPVDDAWRGGTAFDDSAWSLVTGSPGGVGFERSVGYEHLITLDVGDAMYGRQRSCYIRIPFNLAEPAAQFDKLTLRIRYDDGFVAYLNGTEIARRNVAGVPAWNAGAADQNPDLEAMEFEEIDIADFELLLRRAGNVLAIHGVNVSATSSDFLISAALVATVVERRDDVPAVEQYVGPLSLDRSVQVKARSLVGGSWSALNAATFAVGPVAESLRISEIMYHPVDDPNAEYIELVNIGAETIDLGLVEFTAGVRFIFPSVELLPGEYVLIVRDLAAFEARYGPGLPVVGQYDGRLDNAGERVELRDAAGQVIHDFPYEDDWYTKTDGKGYSLTVVDPANTDPKAWADKDIWRPSTILGGSPGFEE
ncbi:CotH kinase family protein [Anaerobaca lacustris]|uniref:CotH kinase family protein n=1 Tax=Anaerobaca lacustris TaxID=3044600 RepID=A0AAW6U3A3_9BACT|nr:CotH kinase family protein [Sedimentisphaerales bacterium M17dextr]